MADEDGARSPSVPAEQEAETQAEGSDRALQLPLARIRKIIKLDKDIGTCGNESSLAIARATELFIEELAEIAYEEARQGKRKTLQYDDFVSAIKSQPRLEFLKDIVPERVPLRKALQREAAPTTRAKGAHDDTNEAAPTKLPGGRQQTLDSMFARRPASADQAAEDGLPDGEDAGGDDSDDGVSGADDE